MPQVLYPAEIEKECEYIRLYIIWSSVKAEPQLIMFESESKLNLAN